MWPFRQAPAAENAIHQVGRPRGRGARARRRLLVRSLLSLHDGVLARLLRQRRRDLHRPQHRLRAWSTRSAIARSPTRCRAASWTCLYFSIETLATVGYGDMHPQSDYGHLVATVEIFTGMSFLAVMTGLVFARFSRPRARFVFARFPIVAQHEGAAHFDDPRRQRAPQHHLRGDRAALAHSRRADRRGPILPPLSRAGAAAQRKSGVRPELDDLSHRRRRQSLVRRRTRRSGASRRLAGADHQRSRRQFRAAAQRPPELFAEPKFAGATAMSTSPRAPTTAGSCSTTASFTTSRRNRDSRR